MRRTISLLALLAASPVFAEEYLVRADVAEATVYAEGAEIIRRIELDLEAGTHRVLFPSDVFELPLVRASDGVVLGAIGRVEDRTLEEGALASPEEQAARAAVDAAEEAVREAEQSWQAAGSALRAAELQQSYLQAIVAGGEDGVAMPDSAEDLATVLATLGAQMEAAQAAQHSAILAQRDLQEVVEDRREELAAARRALADLQPFPEVVDLWSVELVVAEAGPVTLEVVESSYALWVPVYDAHLDSETGALLLERQVALQVDGFLPWRGVDVTLSTADPGRQRAPSGLSPSRASIYEARPATRTESFSGGLADMSFDSAAPMVEPVMVVEDRSAGILVDGLSLSYRMADPVTIASNGQIILPFGDIALEADLINRAVPRRDDTAFLIADIENTAGEPILPGETRFFRDGALIGEGYLDFIPEGAEAELPFGPLDHIQLTWTDLSRDSGDRGVFVSSNTEDRRVLVTAQNLSGEPVELELLYATPFSEQEDLEVEVSASLPPDATAWDDLRGVFAWDLELLPGAEAQIALEFAFDWPDDMLLDWRP